jgi:hypothetical protein
MARLRSLRVDVLRSLGVAGLRCLRMARLRSLRVDVLRSLGVAGLLGFGDTWFLGWGLARLFHLLLMQLRGCGTRLLLLLGAHTSTVTCPRDRIDYLNRE